MSIHAESVLLKMHLLVFLHIEVLIRKKLLAQFPSEADFPQPKVATE